MPYNEHDMVAISTMVDEIFKEEVPQTINGWDVKPDCDVTDGERGLMAVRLRLSYSWDSNVMSTSNTYFSFDPEDPTVPHRIRDAVWSMVRGVIHYTNDFYYANLNEKENIS
ncbi:MAG: hypothetical protein J6U54_01150 [Clostridiales bacterium]|nr:hypothetical protein [Clostridiales bacterium]